MSEKNGGPAFPMATIDGYSQYGITVRDYFAGEALQAVIARIPCMAVLDSTSLNTPLITEEEGLAIRNGMAELAYLYADAMLAERDK